MNEILWVVRFVYELVIMDKFWSDKSVRFFRSTGHSEIITLIILRLLDWSRLLNKIQTWCWCQFVMIRSNRYRFKSDNSPLGSIWYLVDWSSKMFWSEPYDNAKIEGVPWIFIYFFCSEIKKNFLFYYFNGFFLLVFLRICWFIWTRLFSSTCSLLMSFYFRFFSSGKHIIIIVRI